MFNGPLHELPSKKPLKKWPIRSLIKTMAFISKPGAETELCSKINTNNSKGDRRRALRRREKDIVTVVIMSFGTAGHREKGSERTS